LVGYQNDQAVAMIQMILKNVDNDPELADGNQIAHLHNLQVRNEFQNQGFGKEMMVLVERKAKELGKVIITLGVDDTNHKAISIYNNLGYITFKTEPGRTPDEKCLLMKKEIL
ncbi:MAG: GNAT family N-acetyltransferase, partial [bacterium]